MPHGGCTLFLGDDRPTKFRRIQALERDLGIHPFDRHQLDAGEITTPQLLALCRQRPAASSVRLVVVDQAQRLDRACVGALQQHAGVIAESARLILLVEAALGARHPLAEWGTGQPGGPISIERFPGRNLEAVKPFAFTEALNVRDVAGALGAMHDQLMAGRDPLELLGLVAWQLQRWVIVKRLRDTGAPEDRIVAVTGLKPWQVARLQSTIAGRSLAWLQGMVRRCGELDAAVKSGRVVPRLAIEQFVVELCLPADAATRASVGGG